MEHDYYSHNVSSNNNPLVQSRGLDPTHAPREPKHLEDDESDPPPYVSSSTYHEQQQQQQQQQQQRWALPAGWKTAHRESDGRIYYWNLSTGQSSWTHPFALHSATQQQRPLIDLPFFRSNNTNTTAAAATAQTPAYASRHPDSHQCFALFASIAFPPLGICALVHSVLVGRRWTQGRYGESYEHSRQAYTYAWWSVFVSLLVLLWFVGFHGQWPDVRGFFEGLFV